MRTCVRLPICVTHSCAAPAGDAPLSPSLLPSFYQGHLTVRRPRGAGHPADSTGNMAAAEHGRAFFNKEIQKIGDTVCYYRAAFFPKSKGEAAEEGICLRRAQSGPLVKAMTAKC